MSVPTNDQKPGEGAKAGEKAPTRAERREQDAIDEARGYREEERNGAPYFLALDGQYESASESYLIDYVRDARAQQAARKAAGLE